MCFFSIRFIELKYIHFRITTVLLHLNYVKICMEKCPFLNMFLWEACTETMVGKYNPGDSKYIFTKEMNWIQGKNKISLNTRSRAKCFWNRHLTKCQALANISVQLLFHFLRKYFSCTYMEYIFRKRDFKTNEKNIHISLISSLP